jgi:hypothetical protein
MAWRIIVYETAAASEIVRALRIMEGNDSSLPHPSIKASSESRVRHPITDNP